MHSVFSGPCSSDGLLVVKVPRVVHHHLKVVVIVNARRNALVVLQKLIQAHSTVASLTLVLVSEGCFEGVQELDKDVLFSPLVG